MRIGQPDYWLAYLSEKDEQAQQITVIAPCMLDTPRLPPDARALLGTVDTYRKAHPHQRVIFAAEVTRWLHHANNVTWGDLNIDFYQALTELDRHPPALHLPASPIARGVVADASDHLQIFIDGRVEDGHLHTEPCRAAIHAALEHDWPPFIRRVITARRPRT